jgi:hypothetical protein
MTKQKLLYFIGFLAFMMLFSSCWSSRKGRKSSPNRHRCDCSRFSDHYGQATAFTTIDWLAYAESKKNSE